ncbi:MAG: peptide-methionine (R)-S-oxide reductase MsrB [Elusimicrobiota bacterium]
MNYNFKNIKMKIAGVVLIIILGGFIMLNNTGAKDNSLEKATFAGGCFWCMEPPFERLEGVKSVVAGYTGGEKPDPTYKEVASGATDHREAVQIVFDPSKTDYKELLEIFWRQIDPTDAGGQFADRGDQYKTAIFYHTAEQKRTAQKSKEKLQKSDRFKEPVVTRIIPAGEFYEAEDYHQNYYEKSPDAYRSYKKGSGREDYLRDKWPQEKNSIPGDEELKKKLTPLQYMVTQKGGTEEAFNNKYWDNKREGIYVDVVSGEPLFSSRDKFESGTGWPSFTKPINRENITKKEDNKLFRKRIEVKSAGAGSHLGHVFDDGPPPTGKRYCLNSAALRFIPKEDLEEEGYGEYTELFEE